MREGKERRAGEMPRVRKRGENGATEKHTYSREEKMEGKGHVMQEQAGEKVHDVCTAGKTATTFGLLRHRAARRIRRNWLQYTAISCVFFMLCSFVPFAGGCSSGGNADDTPPADTSPSVASLHEGQMEGLKALLASAPELPPSELRSGLSSAKTSLDEFNSEMEEEFALTTDILASLDLPEKMAIHDEVIDKYQESRGRLDAALEGAISSSDPDIQSQAASLTTLLAELCPEEETQPLGTELPNRIIERDPVPPVLGASIAPAYMAGAPGLEPSTLPVEPTEDDLAPTLDAPHTDEIAAKASELGNDPVLIYEWVRNNIDFEPYYGSKKGAGETLAQLAGNDTDTASLLIALDRVSGISARYVTGTIEITAEQAMSWTCVETPEAAQRLIASGGTPIQGIIEGGRLSRFRITHTYTEAYLPYTAYRGVESGEGPKEWVALDGSFKAYEVLEGMKDEIISAMGIDPETWAQNNWGAQIDEENWSFSGMNVASMQSELESAWQDGQAFLESLPEDTTMGEIKGGRMIVEQSPGLLSSVLPYDSNPQRECSELSPGDRYAINVNIGGQTTSLPVPSLGHDSLVIYHEPASEQDRDVITQYGLMANTPAYLIDVCPVLYKGEEELLRGDVRPFVRSYSVRVDAASPAGQIGSSSDSIPAAGAYTIVFDTGKMPTSRLTHDLPGEDYLDLPAWKFSSRMQASLGSTYFCLYDWMVEGSTDQTEIRRVREISWGVFATSYDIGSIMGVPINIDPTGLYTDIDNLNSLCVSSLGAKEEEVAASFTYGVLGSCLESGIYNLSFDVPAVSTARILSVAASQGVMFNALAGDTPQSIIDALNLSSSEKASIQDLIADGNLVAIPSASSTLEDWYGRGWTSCDIENGSSGFYISGQILGGATTSIELLEELGTNDPPSSFLASYITDASLDELTGNASLSEMGLSEEQVSALGIGFFSFFEQQLRLNGMIDEAGNPDRNLKDMFSVYLNLAIWLLFATAVNAGAIILAIEIYKLSRGSEWGSVAAYCIVVVNITIITTVIDWALDLWFNQILEDVSGGD